jgi:hypothetical protein
MYAAAQKHLLAVVHRTIGSSSSSSKRGKGVAPPSGDPVIDTLLPAKQSTLLPLLVKAVAYTKWRYCYFRSQAAVHAAALALQEHKGGAAVAWATEAEWLVKYCYSLAGEFDQVTPVTPRGWHEQQDRLLDQQSQAMIAR